MYFSLSKLVAFQRNYEFDGTRLRVLSRVIGVSSTLQNVACSNFLFRRIMSEFDVAHCAATGEGLHRISVAGDGNRVGDGAPHTL